MKILVSACLMGVACRYDATSKPNASVREFLKNHEPVLICPEVMGGLPIPHPPHEIRTAEADLRVCDAQGRDNAERFLAGARRVLACAREEGCGHAILKSKSPSCGVGLVYDGGFSGTLTARDGVTTELLREAGIVVADENDFMTVFGLE